MVLTIFGTLTWRDSVSVSKALPLCELIIDRLINQSKLDAPTAQHLLFCALKSLQQFSEDDCLLGLLITLNCHLYEKMVSSQHHLCSTYMYAYCTCREIVMSMVFGV